MGTHNPLGYIGMYVDYFSNFEYISVSNAWVREGNGNPLQCSCLENPRDGGAWWLPSMGSHRVGHDWSDLAAAAAAVSNVKSPQFCSLLLTLWDFTEVLLGSCPVVLVLNSFLPLKAVSTLVWVISAKHVGKSAISFQKVHMSCLKSFSGRECKTTLQFFFLGNFKVKAHKSLLTARCRNGSNFRCGENKGLPH